MFLDLHICEKQVLHAPCLSNKKGSDLIIIDVQRLPLLSGPEFYFLFLLCMFLGVAAIPILLNVKV